jgi:beta-lactam-binding protein with PASTA domain
MFIVLGVLSAVGALVYLAGWALKQGSATTPPVVVRQPATKAKKK